MSPQLGEITQETLDMTRGVISKGAQNLRAPTSAAVKTGITVAGDVLYGYPLEEPSKKLYPIEDAMRRRIPRYVNPTGGTYAHWKQVTGINSGKIKAGVAEGAINTAITLTDAELYLAYKTLSMYNTYTDESRIMGRKFEDIPAYAMLATLQNLMIDEDIYIIGGNDHALGQPAAVVAADSGAVGTFGAVPYYIVVSALTLHGYVNAAKGRIAGTDAVDEGIGLPNTAGTVTPTASHGMTISWTDVPGAFAYNVYIGTTSYAAATYRGTTTANLVTYTSPTAAGTGVTNLADQTADAYGYRGILQQLTYQASGGPAVTGAYYKSMDGVAMTADGAGGVTEIETMLQSIFNTARISPTALLINSQEARSIKKLAVGSSSTNAVRVMVSQGEKNEFDAGSAVARYWNPYTAQYIPLIVSLHQAPGKIMAISERVPYPNAETPNNLEVELQQEYYGEEFARTSRITPMAVTCIGNLKLYFPPAFGTIANTIPS